MLAIRQQSRNTALLTSSIDRAVPGTLVSTDDSVVRVEGLEPPMGKTHQILNLAPIPVRLHPPTLQPEAETRVITRMVENSPEFEVPKPPTSCVATRKEPGGFPNSQRTQGVPCHTSCEATRKELEEFPNSKSSPTRRVPQLEEFPNSKSSPTRRVPELAKNSKSSPTPKEPKGSRVIRVAKQLGRNSKSSPTRKELEEFPWVAGDSNPEPTG